MTRREFAATAAGAAAVLNAQPSSRFIKSICAVIFPEKMPYAECFRQAHNAGFAGVEIQLGREITLDSTADQAKQVGESARKAGVAIASMWVSEAFSKNPLNSPDPAVRARGVEDLKKAIELAPHLGCGALL